MPVTLPKVGLCPNKPQKLQGIPIDPPPSVPMDAGPKPPATAALEPPELPPAFKDKFQGLFVFPYFLLCVVPLCPNSGEAVLPKIIAPCSFNFFTTGASKSDLLDRLDVKVPLLWAYHLLQLNPLYL